MTANVNELREADTRVAITEPRTGGQIEALKSKASDALSSPYVRGAALLGLAAAGYTYIKRKKIPERIKKSPVLGVAPKRNRDTGNILKMGRVLVSLVASVASAMNDSSVDAPAPIPK